MIQEYIDTQLESIRQAMGEAAVPQYRQRYEAGPFGEYLPLFASAFVDRDQRLWIAESR